MSPGRLVLAGLAAVVGFAALWRARRQRVARPHRRYADYLTPPAPYASGWFRYVSDDS